MSQKKLREHQVLSRLLEYTENIAREHPPGAVISNNFGGEYLHDFVYSRPTPNDHFCTKVFWGHKGLIAYSYLSGQRGQGLAAENISERIVRLILCRASTADPVLLHPYEIMREDLALTIGGMECVSDHLAQYAAAASLKSWNHYPLPPGSRQMTLGL